MQRGLEFDLLFPMTKFEYVTIAFDTRAFFTGASLNHQLFTTKLNEYGADGWELVNVFDMNRHQGTTFEVVAVLKRPRS